MPRSSECSLSFSFIKVMRNGKFKETSDHTFFKAQSSNLAGTSKRMVKFVPEVIFRSGTSKI
jgi:hypothetical protein